jgi:hypothetical protein
MPRGRSTSADRSVAGLVSRSTMITFVRSLRVGDIVDIEWRIVPLDDKAPDALACPFLTFSGPVISCEDEKCEVMVDYSQVEADGSMTAMGVYPLPPRALTNAFVEVKSLKKKVPPLPTFAQLGCKRPRDDSLPDPNLDIINILQQQAQASQNNMRDFVEAVKGEELKKKIQVCPGLRMIEDSSDIWHPFQIVSWVELMRAQDESSRSSLIAAWKVELLQTISDVGISFSDAHFSVLRHYNDSRDQFARWLSLSPSIPLSTKKDWTFGFVQLFQLMGATAGLRFGQVRGSQLQQEFANAFQASAAVIDIGGVLNRVFRGRLQGSGGSAYEKNRFSKNNDHKSNDHKRLGSDQPVPGAKNEKLCRFCKKYHQSDEQGRDFWRTHRCK